MTQRLAAVVESRWFSGLVLAAILAAGVVAGLETVPSIMARWGGALEALNHVITVIFVVEIALKMAACGSKPWRYFQDGWNVFDFVIVATAFLPLHAEYVTVLRLARLLRFFRLVRALPRLQIIVGALLKSIPSMGYVGLLLFILFYIYGILGVSLFAQNDPFRFANLWVAGLTLFGCATGEGWVDVMYTQMYGCAAYPSGDAPCEVSVAQPIVGAAYFLSFMMVGAMVMLNLLVGVIVNGMEETAKENEEYDRAQRGESLTVADELDLLAGEMDTLRSRLELVRERAREQA